MILKEIYYCTIENKFIHNQHCELCFLCQFVEIPQQYHPSTFNKELVWSPLNGINGDDNSIGYTLDGINWLRWNL
jgi:hypothetical protein